MMRYFYVLLLLCFFSTTLQSQDITLKKGSLNDSIAIAGTESTFSMYLPGSYNENSAGPVLFVFDPYGNASFAIRNFKLAANTFNMPVVALNAPISKLTDENIELFIKLHKSVFSIIPQSKELYFSGFSGGALFATTMAARINTAAGLILCGTNYEVVSKMNYLRNRDMPVIGLVGDEDFTFKSMESIHRFLTRKKIANDLIVYKGGHYWPTAGYLQQALEWIYVKRAITGKHPQHEIVTPTLYKKHYEYANDLVNNNELYLGEKAFTRVDKNYRGLFRIDSVRPVLETIRKNKAFKKYKRGVIGASYDENNILNNFGALLEEDIANASFQNFAFWEEELERLNFYKKGTIHYKKKLKRIKGLLFHVCAESVPLYDVEESINNLLFLHEFMIYIKPDYHKAYIELIKLYTKVGELDNALSSMEALLQNGYTDEDTLQLLPGISTLKGRPEFWDILNTYPLLENKKE